MKNKDNLEFWKEAASDIRCRSAILGMSDLDARVDESVFQAIEEQTQSKEVLKQLLACQTSGGIGEVGIVNLLSILIKCEKEDGKASISSFANFVPTRNEETFEVRGLDVDSEVLEGATQVLTWRKECTRLCQRVIQHYKEWKGKSFM